jgi:phasin family protein
MTPYSEQYTAANKAFFESQLAAFHDLTSIAMDGTEKVVTLNMAAVKASAEESSAAVKDLLAAKNPQAFLALATAYAKPNPEKVAAYNQHLTSIVSGSKAEFLRVAEEQAAEIRDKVSEFINTIEKNAPAGSENLIAMLKSSASKTNAGYEQAHKATKQAVDKAEEQVAKATELMTQATKDSKGK